MTHKSPKIAALMAELLKDSGESKYPPHYRAYFECFNRQMYYEAHDVLEDLWLEKKGDPVFLYYKGLIQLAGAFVHLKKSKLSPAARLFRLAQKNLEPYQPLKDGLGLQELLGQVRGWISELEDSGFTQNPYKSAKPFRLNLRE